jgi:hypothetical protein
MAKGINNIVHNNLGHILTTNKGKSFKNGLYKLKNSTNFYAKCQTVDELSDMSLAYNKYIYGNPIPTEIEKIGASKSNFYSSELIAEVDWFILSARKYKTEINLFLNYKKEFENQFLLGNYTKALNAIDKTEKVIGYSIWAINAKFLVYEYTGNQSKAKLLQTEILEKNKDGVFTTSLINFLSQRSERRLSAHRYDADLRNALNNVRTNLNQSNKDFYNFQLNFFEYLDYTQIKDVLAFDYVNPIADRYLTFRRVILYCLATGVSIEELLPKLKYLGRRIKDDLFGTINLFFDDKFNDESFFDHSYIKVIDLYYAGLYEEACLLIKTLINSTDIDFNLLNLYSRSLVLGNLSFEQLGTAPSLVNDIAQNIFKIYKRNSNPSEALYSLYQIVKNLDNFDISYGISTYIKIEQNIKCNLNYLYLGCKKADPIVAELFTDRPEIIEKVLDKIVAKTFNSISVSYRKKLLQGNLDEAEGIDNTKVKIDSAKLLFNKEKYEESLALWEDIYKDNQITPPVLEASVDYIFRILSKTLKYDEAIKWYVDSVLKNPFLVYKTNAGLVHKALKKGRFKIVVNNIYLPLFVSLVSNDENEKSFAIEMFCKSKGIIFPSEYFSHEDYENNVYTELFYFYCCNNETLKYYKHLNTTKKRLDERINICNYLAKHFEVNKESYSQELNLLTNELIIHEGTQKLDESKIYANDQAILNKDLDEYEGLYNRYITIAGLVLKNLRILTINKNELRLLDKKGEMEYTQNEIEYSEHADIDAFYNVFSVIREKFLFSKFGIVTYLSTRIRHGVLLGELRPELEKNNLIFFKNKVKDRYEPNSFWLNNPKLSSEDKNKLVNLITNFSSKIDTLINKIIKENIQISLNGEHENGWFDYEFPLKDLQSYSITLYYEENYKVFCKKVLEILWARTDENLEKIRTILQDEVKTEFVNIMNEFDSDLRNLLTKEKMPEILTTLTTSSTNIQNKIDKIATWFKRSGKTQSDFKLQNLMDIICTNVQRAHPLKMLEVNSNYAFDKVIKGEFYEHFNDFIRIFIENILKHTVGSKIKCAISISQEMNDIIMVFENDNISPESEIPIEDVGKGVQVDGLKLITEGKSGIMKALKTIKDDLHCEQNDLYIKTDKGKFKVTAKINFTQIIV